MSFLSFQEDLLNTYKLRKKAGPVERRERGREREIFINMKRRKK